jgi:hypothetical protein
MAKIDLPIPEPTEQYSQTNQRQISQSLQTLKDLLNTTFLDEKRSYKKYNRQGRA